MCRLLSYIAKALHCVCTDVHLDYNLISVRVYTGVIIVMNELINVISTSDITHLRYSIVITYYVIIIIFSPLRGSGWILGVG